MPFPIYTYGNMYDRLVQLENDKEEIEKHFGNEVYEHHKEVIEKAKPELLTVENPDEKERPIITAISDFAIDPNLLRRLWRHPIVMPAELNDWQLPRMLAWLQQKPERLWPGSEASWERLFEELALISPPS